MDFLQNETVLKIIVAGGLLLAILSLVAFQFLFFVIFIAASIIAYVFLQKSSSS